MTVPAAALPKSLLGHHRLLSPTAGVHVSPICLGGMSIGSAWSSFMGECSKETAFEVLDYFYSQGGNFIDTANGYQNGESEQWIGEWMELRGRRAEMVVATKYTAAFMTYRGEEVLQSNFGGNSKKSLRVSVDLSLKQLRTEYIDLVG
jgi:aryl-alcohol dehydrogenase-like predicted oxidoreductase